MASDVARDLLVLGLLRRAPMSAYAVHRAVHEHGPLYRPLKRGNIYYTLDRFTERGFVTAGSTPAARGPSRTKTVYRLSAAGEAAFRSLLRATLLDVEAEDAALEVAYVLLGQLRRAEALALVVERHTIVVQHERRLNRLVGDISARRGSGYIGLSRTFSRARAEQRFLRETIALLENAKWSPAWTDDDGPVDDPKRKL